MSSLNLPALDIGDPTIQIFGRKFPIKYLSLFLLVFQNSSLVLAMRYSRTVEGPIFLSSTAVVVSELIKVVTCIFIIFYEESFRPYFVSLRLKRDIIDNIYDTLKVAVPACLYTLQNNLQYVAASNLDAATFQVTYQLKILTTAIFSVCMLGKSLNSTKWSSLVILTLGVALVQLPPDALQKGSIEIQTKENVNQFLGISAVLAACVLSGFAGVYFEKILKDSKVSVWIRNIQLGIFGLIIGSIGAYLKDGDKIIENGFFYGYSLSAWMAVLNQALGGLLVAVVVKYADNILKGYATSLSIIVSCVVSVYLFNFSISFIFVIGSSLVMLAVYLYS